MHRSARQHGSPIARKRPATCASIRTHLLRVNFAHQFGSWIADLSTVYADDMPRHLPVILLLQKLAQQVIFAIFFCIRAVVVSFVWLAILPWVTVWTWRMYFAMGNSTYVTDV